MTQRSKNLARFNNFMQRFAARPMDADELDGFLAGLNCRSETSIQSDWMLLLFNSEEPSIHVDADLERFSRDAADLFEETSSLLAAETYSPEFIAEADETAGFTRFGAWVEGFGRALMFRHSKQSEAIFEILRPFLSMLGFGRACGLPRREGSALSGFSPIVESIAESIVKSAEDDEAVKKDLEEGRAEIADRLHKFYATMPPFVRSLAGR
jgi:hypothetical protein